MKQSYSVANTILNQSNFPSIVEYPKDPKDEERRKLTGFNNKGIPGNLLLGHGVTDSDVIRESK